MEVAVAPYPPCASIAGSDVNCNVSRSVNRAWPTFEVATEDRVSPDERVSRHVCPSTS